MRPCAVLLGRRAGDDGAGLVALGARLIAQDADRLAAVGVESVLDLLSVVPRRYLDRSTVTAIKDLPKRLGTEVGLIAKIKTIQAERKRTASTSNG